MSSPRRLRRHGGGHTNNERWLITYADLITLLMIFFVVLYTFSNVDAKKFQAIAESLSGALGGEVIFENPLITQSEPATDANLRDLENLGKVKEQIEKLIAEEELVGTVTVNAEERGLVISIQNTVFFASGSADLTPYARKIISKVTTILGQVPNLVRVEGHTDNLPINTTRFPSNWELSVLRSTSVVHEMIRNGLPPQRISASGYGEFRPKAPNDTEEHRQQNRRVDFVILREGLRASEPGAVQKPRLEDVIPPLEPVRY
ncbi:MAG: flagellar motor protein MotB [Bacillota bacterium]|uniref:flagellar motor protein MotB n=1 Tax=Desulforudis sp. DRI-14 TaxID=3459793 RepID=UPI0034726D92